MTAHFVGVSTFDGRRAGAGRAEYVTDGFGRVTSKGRYKTSCQSPGYVFFPRGPGFTKVPKNCGKCKHCRWVKAKTRSNQIGFELEGADFAFFYTLTFDPAKVTEAMEDQVLNIRIPAMFIDRLRKNALRGKGSFAGRPVGATTSDIRYIVCGERGEHGTRRCHYHLVIWGKGWPPAVGSGRFQHIQEWKYGHCDIKSDISSGIGFYLSAYMQKDAGNDYVHSESSAIALGAKRIVRLAFQLVQQGASRPPDGYAVTFIDDFRERRAVLRYACKRDFIRAFALASGKSVLDFVPLVAEIMRPALVAVDKWQKERIQMISFRDGVSLTLAEKHMNDEFLAKYLDAPILEGFKRSEASKVDFRRRKVDVFVGRLRSDLARGKRTVVQEKRAEKPADLIERISGMVARGDYIPRRLLPLPEPVRTYSMDRAARLKDRQRALAVRRAAFG